MTMTEYYFLAITGLLKGIRDEQNLNRLYDIVLDTWMKERENNHGL